MQEAGMKHRCGDSEDKLCMCVFMWFCWWIPPNSFKIYLNLAWLRCKCTQHLFMACGVSLATSSKARSWNNTKTLPHWGGKLLVRVRYGTDSRKDKGLWTLPISKQILARVVKACILPADQFCSQVFCHVKFALAWLTIVVLFWGVPFSGEVLFLSPHHLLLTCFPSPSVFSFFCLVVVGDLFSLEAPLVFLLT